MRHGPLQMIDPLMVGALVCDLTEFLLDEGSRVHQGDPHRILLDRHQEIERAPCLVAVLQCWQVQDELMQIFNVFFFWSLQ